ncbi:MAG: hypothetical protein HY541_08325, partial [Deltaproteobacteria bacterium]|nr:hypothetical protein [Deltaproteobacteria bacterium]
MISKFKTYSVIMAVLWLFAAACTGYSDPENDPASSGDAPVAPADESSDEDNLTEEQGSNASSGDISSDASDTVGSSETGEETPSSASEPSGTEEVPASPVPSSEEVASSSLAGPCGDISFSASSTDIADGLPATFEPSGDDWQPIINKYFVVSDEGILAMMNADGSDVVSWDIGGDFEGVTVADPASKYIYIGVENPDGILEFDLSEERVTRTFDLTPWMTGAANAGLEALTFVPDNSNAEGGLFYAGHQGEGKVYVFELPIQSSDNSTTVTFVKKFTPVSGRTDLSGMDYNSEDDVIFLAYDTANKLTAITSDGTVVNEWALPQTDQEGFTQTENCDLFIAQDSGGIRHYEGNDTTLPATAQTLANLAGRLIVVQNNDGSYDWQQDIGNDLTPDVTGYQNVTGV